MGIYEDYRAMPSQRYSGLGNLSGVNNDSKDTQMMDLSSLASPTNQVSHAVNSIQDKREHDRIVGYANQQEMKRMQNTNTGLGNLMNGLGIVTGSQPKANIGNADFNNADMKGKIFISEGGTADGNYSALADIGDGAGLSGGAYQWTEKSGNLQKLAKTLGINKKNYKTNKGYESALSKALGSDQGKYEQDELFINEVSYPVDQYIKRKGIKDNRVRDFLVDTKLNGGYLDVITTVKNKNDYSYPGYLTARQDRYDRLIRKNPAKFSKFKDGWNNRMDRWKGVPLNLSGM